MLQQTQTRSVLAQVSLGEFRSRVEQHAEECEDQRVSTRAMAYGENDRLRYVGGGREAELFGSAGVQFSHAMTRHALSQLSDRLDGPGIGWLGDESRVNGNIRADVVNSLTRNREGAEFLLRSKGDLLRAVLSTEYSVFNHVDYVDLIAASVGELGEVGESVVVHQAEVGDVMRGYVLVPAVSFGRDPQDTGGSGGIHPAVYFTNSEIGTGKVRLHGGLYQRACSNGMIVGWSAEDKLELVHRNLSARTMASAVTDALVRCLRLSEKAAERMLAVSRVWVDRGEVEGLLDDWGRKYGVSLPSIERWREMVSGTSQYMIVNGATLVAQRLEGEEREAMQRMAGDLLFAVLPERVLAGAVVNGGA